MSSVLLALLPALPPSRAGVYIPSQVLGLVVVLASFLFILYGGCGAGGQVDGGVEMRRCE